RRVEPQARDPLRNLLALDLGARQAGLLVAVSERVIESQPDTPRRIVRAERLTKRIGEASIARTDHRRRKAAGPKQLPAAQTAAAIRRLEADVRQTLIAEKVDVGLRVLEIDRRASEIVAAVERLRDSRIDVGRRLELLGLVH